MLLEIDGLTVSYAESEPALRGVSLGIERGGRLGIIGESGCGKTTLVKSVMRMLPQGARVISGDIRYEGASLLSLGKRDMLGVRGRRVSLMPQDVGLALDDMCRIKTHFYDVMGRRGDAEILRLLDRVSLPDAKSVLNSYPFELSGGMKQRVLLALALSLRPGLLIADEPTSSIDAPLRRRVIEELVSISREEGMALIIITHNIRELRGAVEDIAVMYRGEVVERGSAGTVFASPEHEYTRLLLSKR